MDSKKIVTVGVFDCFHLGHLRLFKQAKRFGDYLIVAVQKDAYIKKYKPNTMICFSEDERLEVIEALSMVDMTVLYDDVDSFLKKIDFDIFAVGEDQKHDGFIKAMKWCKENGKEVVELKRTFGVSSTELRNRILNQKIGI